MDKPVCRHCGKVYNYCRACVFKKIPYKEAGFCSKECSAAFKAPKTEIPEILTEEVEIKPKARKAKAKMVVPTEVESEIKTVEVNVEDEIKPVEE